MKTNDLVRHKTYGYYGIIIKDSEIYINGSGMEESYVEIHWMQGDLNPIWFVDHQCLEILNEDR